MPGLLLGSAPRHRDIAALARMGVTAIVDLRVEAPIPELGWPAGVILRRLPVRDRCAPDLEHLDELVGWIRERLEAGQTVLVHCQGGMGRSATVACAVLIDVGYTLPEAYRLLRDRRAVIAPTDEQLRCLERYAERVGERQAPQLARAGR